MLIMHMSFPPNALEIFLANGHLPMEFTATSVPPCYAMLRDTPREVDIASQLAKISGDSDLKHYPISFIEWKDDCEPSKLNKKSKNGSLWIWTMTIIGANNKKDSPEATFPLVIWYKNDDHNGVERIFMEDFRHMATTIGCWLSLGVLIVDRPKK
jgi:hypothetical protein